MFEETVPTSAGEKCRVIPDPPDPLHRARLAWLAAHPQIVATLPGVTDDLTPAHLEALDQALHRMQRADLYPSALLQRPPGLRWAIRLLVSETRGDAVTDKDRRWALRGASEGM